MMNLQKSWWYLCTQVSKMKYGSIGRRSYIGPVSFVQRKKNLFIGDNVRIYPGLRAEMTTSSAQIIVENNVSIGQNFHVVSYEGALRIGMDTTISGNVFISNVNHDYHQIGVHILDQDMIKKDTEIGNNCFIGYGAVIMPGTKLGKQCIVGANAVVSGVFPDYSVIVGAPARVVKRYDAESQQWLKV